VFGTHGSVDVKASFDLKTRDAERRAAVLANGSQLYKQQMSVC